MCRTGESCDCDVQGNEGLVDGMVVLLIKRSTFT